MPKDELIRLKKKLETKKYIEDAYDGSGAISLFEIEQRINAANVVEKIDKYFESIIRYFLRYFSSKGIKYDEITLRPLFSIIVKEKNLDENTIIKPNSKPLSGTAVVRINGFYYMNGEQKMKMLQMLFILKTLMITLLYLMILSDCWEQKLL